MPAGLPSTRGKALPWAGAGVLSWFVPPVLAGEGGAGLAVPASTALTAARRRLGERPLELLFWRVAGVLLPSRDPWATVCGLLVVAWDGTTLKVPASPENTAAFG